MLNFFMFFLCVIVWGSSYWFAKTQMEFAPPEFSLMLRLIVALIFFLLLYSKSHKHVKLKKSNYIDIGVFGFCNFMAGYLFLYLATKSLPSGLVVVIFSFKSILTPLMIAIKNKEKPKLSFVIGALIAIIGIVFLMDGALSHNLLSSMRTVGIIYALLGTIITSIGDLFSAKNNDNQIHPVYANLVGILCVIPFLLIINVNNMSYFIELKDIHYLFSILYLGVIASGIAWLCYLYLVKNIGASYSSYMVTLFPIIGCMTSILLENMVFSINSMVGLLFEVCGLLIVFAKWDSFFLFFLKKLQN